MKNNVDDCRALNNGRRYDCGRVPPLPKQKGRTDQKGINIASHCFTLLSFLTTSHTNKRKNAFSESGWRRRIERGQILVDGTVVTNPDHILSKAKQRVEYHRYPWTEPIVHVQVACEGSKFENDNQETILQILYADDHLMVVHKPSGLPTMPSQTFFEYSILNALRRIYCMDNDPRSLTNVTCTTLAKQWIQSHCSMEPQPVHRLGVGTSGVLVVATSQLGRQKLTDAIRHKSNNNDKKVDDTATVMKKVYRALVFAHRCDDRPWNTRNSTSLRGNGPVIPDSFTIDCPIGLVPFPIGGDNIHAACPQESDYLYGRIYENKNSFLGKQEATVSTPDSAKQKKTTKPALSHVKVVKRKENGTAIVEVEIPTGRPHQIRIHMAYAGYPLVGDPLYLPGGIPNTEPRNFEAMENEEEDMDTDDEDDDANQSILEKWYIQRVALPRDCGYYLHAHSITLEHPCSSDADASPAIAGSKTTMTFTATPPPILRG